MPAYAAARPQLTWDDDGRLVQVSGMGANQRNVYDASGVRVIRSSRDGDTVFASPYFDVANDTTGTKHVFAGALRVASVLRAFSGGADPPPPPSTATGSSYGYGLRPNSQGRSNRQLDKDRSC